MLEYQYIEHGLFGDKKYHIIKQFYIHTCMHTFIEAPPQGIFRRNVKVVINELYYLALINRARGLYRRILTEVANTDRTQ